MASTQLPDLMTMLIGIGKVIPSFIMLMQTVAVVVGVFLTISGLMELAGAHNQNLTKHMSSQQAYSTQVAGVKILLGGVLLSLSTLELIGVLSRTITGDYAATRMTADVLSYAPGKGASAAEKSKVVVLALLALMQAVGMVSVFKGIMTLNAYAKQTTSVSFGTCLAWIIGGILAWNFKWFSDVINNTIGFDFLKLFSLL